METVQAILILASIPAFFGTLLALDLSLEHPNWAWAVGAPSYAILFAVASMAPD